MDIEEIVKNQNKDAAQEILLGVASQSRLEFEAAAIHYIKAAQLDPEHESAYKRYAEMYVSIDSENTRLAVQDLTRSNKIQGLRFCEKGKEILGRLPQEDEKTRYALNIFKAFCGGKDRDESIWAQIRMLEEKISRY